MSKQISIRILFTIIIIAFLAFGTLIYRQRDSGMCTPVLPVTQSKEMANSLDKQAAHFASTTTDITDRSAEGGTQITLTQNGIRKIVEQRFYGETGRSYMRFYFNDNKIFEVIKLIFTYAVPLSVDSNGSVKTSDERDYYLDIHGKVCGSDVNGISQPIDTDTQDMIQEYLSGIL
jgi:hypothetical protein